MPAFPPLKAICVALLLGAMLPGAAVAEHIIGGEMFYTCTGPGQYTFTMKLYRDCFSSGANFDNPGNFGVFDQNGNLVEVVQAPVQTVQNINTNIASPCMVLPPNICVEEGIYSFNVTVANPGQRYTVVYQRCCRNGTIQNLINPGAQGLSIESTIPPFDDVGCNSSPSFNNFPPPVLCAQEQLIFDHSATDMDGDSLAYSLCSPFIGGTQSNPLPLPPSNPPYNEVTWAGVFGGTNPLPGNPGLTIDAQSGLLTGVPTQLGQYVIGVCVEEWRDGVLLSVNTRDFQFNVAFCEPPSEAIINTPDVGDLCQGLTVGFTSSSAPSNIFFWDFGDEDGIDPFSSAINPTYTFSDTGLYKVTLITNPGFFCSDTFYINVPIYYAAQISAAYEGVACIDNVQNYSFSASGVFDEGAPVTWNFGPGATPQTANQLEVSGITFDSPGPKSVQVQVINNACSASDIIDINVAPPAEVTIIPQTEFCKGYTYAFAQESANASTFIWNFGVDGDSGVSTDPNPTFTFPGDGEYTVTVTASGQGNCPVQVEEVFDIKSLLSPQVPTFPIQCFENQNFDFAAMGSFSNAAQFAWNFENGLPETANTSSVNDVLFLEAGTHNYSLSISENGCTRVAGGTVSIHNNPVADFDGAPLTGCAPLEVSFRNTSVTESTNTSYRWNFGDGSPPASLGGSFIYNEPGIYTVSLKMQNLNGCIDSDEKVREAYVHVLPVPIPGFLIEPLVISSIEPDIRIINASLGGTSCSYYFDDEEFTECNFSTTLNNVIPQMVTQRVTNESGCFAETSRNFRVSDHLIYIPNSFTPNGDGINDIFEPVLTGAAKYSMYIIDRWGREIYAQDEVTVGWDGGGRNGEYFAQAGLYQYIIVLTDFGGWNFKYTGTVLLAR